MNEEVEHTIDFKSIYNSVIQQLEHELPSYLTYHDAEHTKGVVTIAQRLAVAEGINKEETFLLLTAALFHDTGFLRTYRNHEENSCDIARKTLPEHGYTTAQIDVITSIIMATKLPNRPTNKLQDIICDADLHYLGTDHYFPIAETLYNEFLKEGFVTDRKDWAEKQITFLEAHTFFTPTAQRLYNAKKAEHLRKLKSSLPEA